MQLKQALFKLRRVIVTCIWRIVNALEPGVCNRNERLKSIACRGGGY